MSKEHILDAVVPFADVDRHQVMLLPRLFKLLQEAAIEHAELFGVGVRGLEERGTSWVLNRLAVVVNRYPKRDESLRVTTWSTGVQGFRGYREFRLHAGSELLLSASSLWLWIDLRTRTLARVPEDLVRRFPLGDGSPPCRPDIDRMRMTPPGPTAAVHGLDLRYSDIDANGHVNHTAYFDLLQSALDREQLPVQPHGLDLQFLREIPAGTRHVQIRLEKQDTGSLAFSLGNEATVFAQGLIALA